MSKKNRRGPAPVPPGNQSPMGPSAPGGKPLDDDAQRAPSEPTDGTGFQEQDAQRRLGNYGGAGEHPYVQPGGRNDADR